MEELVSIIVPNYNKEKYLRYSIESILNQTYKNIELIIVDDGSIDQSIEVISEYEKFDSRLHLYKCTHKGKIDAINFGVSRAKGNFIKISGSDDVMLENAINDLVCQCEGFDVVAHNCSVTDENLFLIEEKFVDIKTYENGANSINDVIHGKGYPSGLYMMKRNVADSIYPINENATYEDWYIYMMLRLNSYTIKYYDKSLTLYRQVPNSAFGGVYNNNREVFLYRNKRDIKMLELFREILPDEYDNEISNRLYKLKLTADGTFGEIMFGKFVLKEKIQILIKRYFYNLYVQIVNIKINMKKIN